jgi:hypothetical protein
MTFRLPPPADVAAKLGRAEGRPQPLDEEYQQERHGIGWMSHRNSSGRHWFGQLVVRIQPVHG